MAGHFGWFTLLLAAFAAEQVHGSGLHLIRTPPRTMNATARELTPEYEDLLIELLSIKTSEVNSLIQSWRRLLQNVRQWQASHPAESRLAKCVILYCASREFPEPAPAAVAPVDDEDYDGDGGFASAHGTASDKTEKDRSTEQSGEDDPGDFDSKAATDVAEGREIFQVWTSNETKPSVRSIKGGIRPKLALKGKVVKALRTVYMHMRDLLSQYKLLGCGFHYFLSKFWEWVDSAP